MAALFFCPFPLFSQLIISQILKGTSIDSEKTGTFPANLESLGPVNLTLYAHHKETQYDAKTNERTVKEHPKMKLSSPPRVDIEFLFKKD